MNSLVNSDYDDFAPNESAVVIDRLPLTFIQSRSRDSNEKFAVDYLNELFKWAMQTKVSDIHFESLEQGNICRVRKDGTLRQYKNILTDIQFRLIQEKLYSRAMIEESYAKTHSVDSRGWLRYDDTRLDLRISSMPTTHGYSIVTRLLDQSNSGKSLDHIEMRQDVRDSINNVIRSAHGLILITGPTGSGKTTTLYSFLNELNTLGVKIFTIENPVEYTIPNVQHVNVDADITFHSALRSALRQDPDIILIGEIRDSETAKIAIEAAQTGHLVLSTLHTNSSVGAISRLMELGVDGSHINETLLAVSAQRLIRKCVDVRNLDVASNEEKQWLRNNGFSHLTNKPFGRGISKEHYSGRLPIIELMLMTDDIRANIAVGNIAEIYNDVKKQKQYETLTDAAVRLASEGKTSLEEAISISSASKTKNLDGLLLGERLLVMNYLTAYQLSYAQSIQRQSSDISRKKLADILIELHYCSMEQIMEVGDAPDA